MSDIKAEIRTLADQIKAATKIDEASGVATLDKEFYKTTLPEGLTVEAVEAYQAHNTQLAAAAGLALGEVSLDFMKKHKDVKKTELVMPMVGKDQFNATFTRSRPLPGGAEGLSYGSLSVGFDHYATNGGAGELKKVKSYLSDKAASILAD